MVDIAGDGDTDLVTRDGDGSFRPLRSTGGVSTSTFGIILADLTGSGLPDILLPAPESASWFENVGDGLVARGQAPPSNTYHDHFVTADLDRDGATELLAGRPSLDDAVVIRFQLDTAGDACDVCPSIANPEQRQEAACFGFSEDGRIPGLVPLSGVDGTDADLCVIDESGATDCGRLFISTEQVAAINDAPCGPPVADAGGHVTAECDSTDGASILLDGSGSTDPNQPRPAASELVGSASGRARVTGGLRLLNVRLLATPGAPSRGSPVTELGRR